MQRFFTPPGYTFNYLFSGASKLGSRGRLRDGQNNWRARRLDGRVMPEASGDATQIFPDTEHKLSANPTSKQ